jgi:hypothetical protein
MQTDTLKALSDLTTTPDFSAALDSLSLEQKVEAYMTALFAEEAAKTRREAIREHLLKAAQEQGESNGKGGQRLTVGEHLVNRERRVATNPDEKKLIGLLEKKGIPTEQAFDRVTVLQPNPSKVTALVETGHLSEEDAKALYKETFACVVRASRDLEALLENALPASLTTAKKR